MPWSVPDFARRLGGKQGTSPQFHSPTSPLVKVTPRVARSGKVAENPQNGRFAEKCAVTAKEGSLGGRGCLGGGEGRERRMATQVNLRHLCL